MRCPHCDHVATHKVVETRKFEGDVYRRRRCSSCSCAFVSVETSDVDMQMPAEVSYYGRERTGKRRERSADGAHLQGIFS